MTEPNTLQDFNLMVAGQGGDGSLTVMTVLSELLGHRGYHLYKARNVASRIKGGIAAALMRASVVPRGCMGDGIDLMVAFDQEAVTGAGHRMTPGGTVVFDSSDHPLDRSNLPADTHVVEVPFGRFAVRDLRRDLFKNSMSFGLVSRLLNVDAEEAEACLRHTLRKLSQRLLAPNIESFARGRAFAELPEAQAADKALQLDTNEKTDQLIIGGNEALAFGFAAAGGRFFAGYPITPASEILEWSVRHQPSLGGVAMQAEDELAAVNIAIGAAMTGVRTMTATSSPGFSLMQEGISHAGSAEIPLVIVNSQRSGPSTGMPTKPEQSDLDMIVFGGNGDFPRVVLAPGTPSDCFELGVVATNLAQRLQCPVMVAVDQMVAQDSRTTTPFDLQAVEPETGSRLDADALAELDQYRRYELTPGGVSPWAIPGTPGGMSLVTGNERNEWGLVSTAPPVRKAMADKRAEKTAAIPDLPKGVTSGDASARIALLGIGMQSGVIAESCERLNAQGLAVKTLQPRTLWPMHEETTEFILSCDRVYVVEHNVEGQLLRLLNGIGAFGNLHSIRRYDGVPFGPAELAKLVMEHEAMLIGDVA